LYDIPAAEKGKGMKFCMRVCLLSGQGFSLLLFWRSKVKVTRDKKRT